MKKPEFEGKQESVSRASARRLASREQLSRAGAFLLAGSLIFLSSCQIRGGSGAEADTLQIGEESVSEPLAPNLSAAITSSTTTRSATDLDLSASATTTAPDANLVTSSSAPAPSESETEAPSSNGLKLIDPKTDPNQFVQDDGRFLLPDFQLDNYASTPFDFSSFRPEGFKPQRYPTDATQQFGDILVTPAERFKIILNAMYLLGVPYVYPPKVTAVGGPTYWAPKTIYTQNYLDLLYSLDHYREVGKDDFHYGFKYGADCSAFVKSVIDYSLNVRMSDHVATIHRWYRQLHPDYERDAQNPDSWESGDLIIFSDPGSDRVDVHIGIYYGSNLVINSVGDRIRVNRLDDWSFREDGQLNVQAVYRPPGRYLYLS